MPDKHLHGNGKPCPACELRRAAHQRQDIALPCNKCGGTGHLPIPTRTIISQAVAEARRHYWPAVEARWRAWETDQVQTGKGENR